jgi:PPP family 3-phenylpropionic acid transporter
VEQRRLYLIYSTFYFAYFAALGIFAPYFPLYLKSLGFGGPAIAILLALGPVSRFLFPALWGLWADRAGHRKLLVVLTSCGACGAFSLLYWAQSFWAVALVLFLYGFLLAPSIPLVEGMVQEESDRRRFAYGPVRLWGSLGFIASTLFYGRLLDRQPVETILMGILLFSSLTLFPAVALPSGRDRAPLTRRSLRSELMRSETLRFLAATTLMQASHGAYYAYFSLHLDRHGYSRSAIGAYWTLAVAAEIGMMLLPRGFSRRPVRRA